jgi:cysteine-rich repeat protein
VDSDLCSSACAEPRCGDGIVAPWESCDDGNTVDTDACPNHCGGPYCGDGIVQTGVEECDSGGHSTATCTPDCKTARCGDGYLAPRVEACDDGNTVDDDACPNDCSKATCGDGITSLGWEECDPLDPIYANACSANCVLVGLCGDANADQKVTTADAGRILKRAVDLPVDCPKAACDMDANKRINVLDAQMDLQKAVGIPVGDKCSIGTGTIVFWIDDTRAIGSFQLEVDYSSTGGSFKGSGGEVECNAYLDEDDTFLAAFNDMDSVGVLNAGFVATKTFGGRLDLFHCEFEMPEERAGTHFAIRVVESSDADFNPITPPPLVGYRVE